jgi:hypothetical protein
MDIRQKIKFTIRSERRSQGTGRHEAPLHPTARTVLPARQTADRDFVLYLFDSMR